MGSLTLPSAGVNAATARVRLRAIHHQRPCLSPRDGSKRGRSERIHLI